MASSNSPLLLSSPSSIKDLQNWVINITKNFENHLLVDTSRPACIFQLPQTLTTQKPESYLPQHIGLGPIHHFRPDLYSKQEHLKLIATKTFQNPNQMPSEFQKLLLETVKKLVPKARRCYDFYFDTDDDTLAWIFVLDGLFLPDVLSKVAGGDVSEYLEDVMMLENQIPFLVFVELLNEVCENPSHLKFSAPVTQLDLDSSFPKMEADDVYEITTVDIFDLGPNSSITSTGYASNGRYNFLVDFCKMRSPLKFSTPRLVDAFIHSRFHLLDCMYHLIVDSLVHAIPGHRKQLLVNYDITLTEVENAVQMAGGLFPAANVVLQPILVILRLPWDKIASFFKKMVEENPTALEIDIPSASKLSRIGKIEFRPTPGGIHDIEFDEGKLTFGLPVLDLKSDSEVILRNLVAYEGLMFEKGTIKNLVLTEYVDLMCGIIDGVKDVNILREKNIIQGNMEDMEIVKIFNGITKSSEKTDGRNSKLQKTIAKVNKNYGDVPRVKVYRFIKKLFLASWKIFAIMFSVLSLILMIITGVCEIYECKGHFGIGNARLLLAYATGNNQLSNL